MTNIKNKNMFDYEIEELLNKTLSQFYINKKK